MRITAILTVVAAFIFAANASAQTPSLSLTGNGEPGTTVTADVTGATVGATYVCVSGFHIGSYNLPGNVQGSNTLGILGPNFTFGTTIDAQGAGSASFSVPSANMGPLTGTNVYFQAAIVWANNGPNVATSTVQTLVLP